MQDFNEQKIIYICVSEQFMLIAHVGQIFLISYFLCGETQVRKGNKQKITRSLDLCFLMHLDIAICISDIFC